MNTVPIHMQDDRFIKQNIHGRPMIVRAYLYLTLIIAQVLHLGQTRRIGGRAVEHPMVVSNEAFAFGLGTISQAVSLLHDTLEDLKGHKKIIAIVIVLLFTGPIVLLMVIGVTNWWKDNSHKYFRWIIWFASIFWPIIVIKVLDRIHNLVCPYGGSIEKEIKKLRETLHSFRAACRICRRYIPARFLARYDERVAYSINLAKHRLAELSAPPVSG